MKKLITAGIAAIACVALCAAVWPWCAEVGDLPAEPVKVAVTAEFGASAEKPPIIFLSADTHTSEAEIVVEIEPPPPVEPVSKTASTPPATPKPSIQPSSNPKSGERANIDGKPHTWIPGFGWIEDEGSGSVSRVVDGKGDINKQVGVMGGGTTVGNPGDELTGNKVGIIGGGTVAEDMYENGHKIGIIRSESLSRESTPPTSGQPEPVEGEIIIVFVEVPEKNSTPPPYKPDTPTP